MQLPVINDPSLEAAAALAPALSKDYLSNLTGGSRVPTGPVAMSALPMTMKAARLRGWDELDVVFVTGDAYIDHPSFAMAILGRVLEAAGYRVGIVSQPDWRSCDAWREFGRPRLFFGISAGQHGFDDQPLHGQQEGSQRRRVLARRPNRIATRPRDAVLLPTRAEKLSKACP